MCSSCDQNKHPATALKTPLVALVGRPNVGKSTLFSRISGIHRKMGNWPATTVEVGSADIVINGEEFRILDLPGISSLSPTSPDEELTHDILMEDDLDLIVAIVDASNIARCLFLVSQLKELNKPMVVALTMTDIARRRGIHVDIEALSRGLDTKVVAVLPRSKNGTAGLEELLTQTLAQLKSHEIDTTTPSLPLDDDQRINFVSDLITSAVTRTSTRPTLSDRVDRFLTAPFSGALTLLGVLWIVFQSTTTLASPFQNWISSFISGVVVPPIESALTPIPWLRGLIVDGVISGVGTLLTFLPVMSTMFLLLSLLEDSGYMARAAVVSDRVMRFAGLPGKALLPLIVGFGCNVPAVSATRALSDARHRLIVGLSVPFTACSARLAVYIFVAGIFFGKNAGTVVFGMYIVSITLVILFALFLKLTFIRGATREPLLIELPPYRLPTTTFVFADAWLRVRGFLKEVGGIVVITVVAIWILMAIPIGGDHQFGNTPVNESAYGAIAKGITPLFAPAGFADWHTAGALVTGFVAKEVVISSWAQNYSVDSPNRQLIISDLGKELQRDFERSSSGHSSAAVLAFLIFLTSYTPCVATVAAQRREFGMKWALTGVVSQLAIAWLLAVAVFQTGRLLF
ncbi:MAG TPA: ferrous iron transport protein B [Candidatus Paceibacterota bacterium]|nr:ferrous iron transport protein B [Candidatus Paceibacterota bacterium]